MLAQSNYSFFSVDLIIRLISDIFINETLTETVYFKEYACEQFVTLNYLYTACCTMVCCGMLYGMANFIVSNKGNYILAQKTGKAIRPIKHKNLKDDLTKQKKAWTQATYMGTDQTLPSYKKKRTG